MAHVIYDLVERGNESVVVDPILYSSGDSYTEVSSGNTGRLQYSRILEDEGLEVQTSEIPVSLKVEATAFAYKLLINDDISGMNFPSGCNFIKIRCLNGDIHVVYALNNKCYSVSKSNQI